jgi:hypothetical protein
MSRHRTRTSAASFTPVLIVAVVAALIVALVIAITTYTRRRESADPPSTATPTGDCPTTVKVVTATSFAPVLRALTAGLAGGGNCVRPEITIADGRAAAGKLKETDADVWIPDDAAWAGMTDRAALAKTGTVNAGAVLATSPIAMMTDRPTAERINQAGGSWRALAKLAEDGQSGVRLAVRDPSGSGDGMVAAGAVADGIWNTEGMDASSVALANAAPLARTVSGAAPAVPERPGDVGLVPEYALPASLPPDTVFLTGTDGVALMRYTWQPTAAAVADARRTTAATTLFNGLRGAAANRALAAAHLRGPDAETLSDAPKGPLPALTGKPFDVLSPHQVDHIFAAWYAADRRVNLLMVIDISGSMKDPAPGTATPLIDVVRQGCQALEQLLPDDARLGLWEFGHNLVPPNDYRELLPGAPLAAAHRQAWNGAVGALAARRTGTGLYDTILAAYTAARDGYQTGMPNHVFVFTDGRNEDDPGGITVEQLTEGLKAATDPARPVQLSVVAYGPKAEADRLAAATKPIGGYVDAPQTAAEVGAVFIHTAAGGIHG